MGLIQALYLLLRAFVVSRAILAAENLALRQQLSVLEHAVKRARLRSRDRRFWVWLLAPLAQLALRAADRPARHRDQMASDGLQALLAMEIETQEIWLAPDQQRDPRFDLPYGPGESVAGCTSYPV